MAYSPNNITEAVSLPQDVIFDGVITSIQDGTVKDFVKKNLESWEGSTQTPAINVYMEVTYNGKQNRFNQLFTYQSVDGKTAVSPKSNMAKFKKKYGVYPTVGTQIKAITNSEGFLRLKLE